MKRILYFVQTFEMFPRQYFIHVSPAFYFNLSIFFLLFLYTGIVLFRRVILSLCFFNEFRFCQQFLFRIIVYFPNLIFYPMEYFHCCHFVYNFGFSKNLFQRNYFTTKWKLQKQVGATLALCTDIKFMRFLLISNKGSDVCTLINTYVSNKLKLIAKTMAQKIRRRVRWWEAFGAQLSIY